MVKCIIFSYRNLYVGILIRNNLHKFMLKIALVSIKNFIPIKVEQISTFKKNVFVLDSLSLIVCLC